MLRFWKKNHVLLALLVGSLGGVVAVAYAAGGDKKLNEECKSDSECKHGHCYKKKSGDKVCVNCSSSTISSARYNIQKWCKDEPSTCKTLPSTPEIAEEFFEDRIKANEECIKARKHENERCWGGGDSGHREAVTIAERKRETCRNKMNTHKGLGKLYNCSDSTYNSKSSDVKRYCSAYGDACKKWKKDDKVVDCDDIDDVVDDVDDCVEKIKSLDSSCLPRLSEARKKQLDAAESQRKYCKEVLEYKKSKSLCD